MIIKLSDKVKVMTIAVNYAAWWSGCILALGNKYPFFKFPTGQTWQFYLTLPLDYLPKPYNVTMDMTMEDDKTIVHIEYQDGSPTDIIRFNTPSVNISATFDELNIVASSGIEYENIGMQEFVSRMSIDQARKYLKE